MHRILAAVVGCSLVAGLLTAASPAAPAAAGIDRGAGSYGRVDTRRVLDTRTGLGGLRGTVSPGHTVTFAIPGGSVMQSAVLDVTVPTPAPAGSLSVYPGGTTWDGRVTMTLTGGGNIQQQLTVALGTGATVTIRSNAARPTNLIVDLLGYYAAGIPVLTGMFGKANGRVLDTRKGIGAPRAPVGAGRKVTVALPGRAGIPRSGAVAVVVDVAVLTPRSTGQLAITDGDGRLATTRLRFVGSSTAPQTMQTERTVMLGSDGTLSFTNGSASSVQLVVDVFGYFLRGGLEPEWNDLGYYLPVSPQPVAALRVRAHRTVEFYPPGVTESIAANLVMTTDQPTQSVALGVYYPYANYPGAPWNGSPLISSSPWLQPTELTVDTGVWYVMVANLKDTDVALHCYVTGTYYVSPGI